MSDLVIAPMTRERALEVLADMLPTIAALVKDATPNPKLRMA